MGEATSAAASPVAMTSRRSDALIDERPALAAPGGVAARPAGPVSRRISHEASCRSQLSKPVLSTSSLAVLRFLAIAASDRLSGLIGPNRLLGVAVGMPVRIGIFVVRVRRQRLRGVGGHEGDQLHGLGLVAARTWRPQRPRCSRACRRPRSGSRAPSPRCPRPSGRGRDRCAAGRCSRCCRRRYRRRPPGCPWRRSRSPPEGFLREIGLHALEPFGRLLLAVARSRRAISETL